MSVPSWRGRDPQFLMGDAPAWILVFNNAVVGTSTEKLTVRECLSDREREELKASTDKIFAGLDEATKEKP